jgi:hypothetical protein
MKAKQHFRFGEQGERRTPEHILDALAELGFLLLAA